MANSGDRTMIDEEEFDPMAELLAEINEGEKPIGKRGRRAVLSRDQVEYIQQSDKSIRELAREIGVSHSTIQLARSHGYRTRSENGAHSYREAVNRQLPKDQIEAIATDPRSAEEIATDYNISRSYVYAIRAKHRGPKKPSILPPEVMNHIISSDLDDETMAERLGVTSTLIRLIRKDAKDAT